MDFTYRYRELLLGTLRFLPQDFREKIETTIKEEDDYLEAQAQACAQKAPANFVSAKPDLLALFQEVGKAGLMMQAMAVSHVGIDKTDEEQIAADLAYVEARLRLVRAETAYDQALRAVVEGAPCAQ